LLLIVINVIQIGFRRVIHLVTFSQNVFTIKCITLLIFLKNIELILIIAFVPYQLRILILSLISIIIRNGSRCRQIFILLYFCVH